MDTYYPLIIIIEFEYYFYQLSDQNKVIIGKKNINK